MLDMLGRHAEGEQAEGCEGKFKIIVTILPLFPENFFLIDTDGSR